MDDNMTIHRLKGPDRIRKRPAVVFNSTDRDGVANAVEMVLDIFITEAALGYSNGLEMTLHKDDSIGIRSYDRGFLLDGTVVDGKPAWFWVFCEFYLESYATPEKYFFSLGSGHNALYGEDAGDFPKYRVDNDHAFTMCCVQYASRFMRVEGTRDGVKRILDFEKGYSVSDLREEPSEEPSNTYVRFQADPEVFDAIAVPGEKIAAFLRDAAITLPGFRCEFFDEKKQTKTVFYYPGGAEDYAKEFLGASLSVPLFSKEMEVRGKDRYNRREYDAKVKVVLTFSEGKENVSCLHNYRMLECGGEHLETAKKQLVCAMNWEFAERLAWQEDKYVELRFSDFASSLFLMIETNCTKYDSAYVDATKKAIKNRMVCDMTADLLDDDFRYYLKKNHSRIMKILRSSLEKARANQK